MAMPAYSAGPSAGRRSPRSNPPNVRKPDSEGRAVGRLVAVDDQRSPGRGAPTLRSVTRFLTLDDVADELAISRSQAYALVRNGTLPAMKVGGRGQWRVERTRLEQWIEQAHVDTSRFVADHPFTRQVGDELE